MPDEGAYRRQKLAEACQAWHQPPGSMVPTRIHGDGVPIQGSTAKSIPVPPRSEEEEMLSDNEIKIQGLESQLQAVKGASKREKRGSASHHPVLQ